MKKIKEEIEIQIKKRVIDLREKKGVFNKYISAFPELVEGKSLWLRQAQHRYFSSSDRES